MRHTYISRLLSNLANVWTGPGGSVPHYRGDVPDRTTGTAAGRQLTATNLAATDSRQTMSVRVLLIVVLTAVLAYGCQTAPLVPDDPTDFLGPDAFKGTYKPRSGGFGLGGESDYRGQIVMVNVDRSIVEQLIPNKFRLAKRDPKPADGSTVYHPVIVMLGDQTNTNWDIGDWDPEVGDDYRELIVLVPFLQRKLWLWYSKKWHNYAGRMYLNDYPAILLGNLFYGYNKRRAMFDGEVVSEATPTTTVTAINEAGNAYFSTTATRDMNWLTDSQAEQNLANYVAMKSYFEIPITGRPTLSPDYVCSYFEMDFSGARVARLNSSQNYTNQFKQDVPGASQWPPSISSVDDGAIVVKDLEWRVAAPPGLCHYY